METIYLDTHVVIWLFSAEIDKISDKALEFIEECELLISPMVVLELKFLYEIGRLNYNHNYIVSSLSKSIDLKVCNLPFSTIAQEATKHNWTRDPFDRLIVANAICNNSYILTKDKKILDNSDKSIW